MSKKYKLKKWYPSLPKNWKKGHMITDVNRNYLTYVSCDEYKPGSVEKEEVENNSEFWEKVVEKDYEILSFSNEEVVHKHPLYILKEDGFYHYKHHSFGYPPSRSTKEKLLSLDGVKIHSVKRFSDGEVFTVGDRIDSYCESGHITKFEISTNNLKVHFLDDKSTYQKEWTFLNSALKPKNPLFTTEDGVDIYEVDSFYPVAINRKYGYLPFVVCNQQWTKRVEDLGAFVYFSSKEKAEEWIDENKPKYSKNDVSQIIDKSLLNFTNVWKGTCYVIDLNKVKEQL